MDKESPLDMARRKAAEMRAAGIEPERKDPLKKCRDKPTSLRLALNAKCFDCVGQLNADGGYRRAIRECPVTGCPLHQVRPYQRKDTEDEQSAHEADPTTFEGG